MMDASAARTLPSPGGRLPRRLPQHLALHSVDGRPAAHPTVGARRPNGMPPGHRPRLPGPASAPTAGPRPAAVVYRRRRLVATAVAAAVAATCLYLVGAFPTFFGGSSDAHAAASHPDIYTVRAGDTLWGIATRLSPNRDPRPLVAQFAGQLHGTTVYVGEQIVLP